jgi:hypothetical protein
MGVYSYGTLPAGLSVVILPAGEIRLGVLGRTKKKFLKRKC